MMFWFKAPVFIDTHTAGDVQTSCQEYLVSVARNTAGNCTMVSLKISSGVMLTDFERVSVYHRWLELSHHPLLLIYMIWHVLYKCLCYIAYDMYKCECYQWFAATLTSNVWTCRLGCYWRYNSFQSAKIFGEKKKKKVILFPYKKNEIHAI